MMSDETVDSEPVEIPTDPADEMSSNPYSRPDKADREKAVALAREKTRSYAESIWQLIAEHSGLESLANSPIEEVASSQRTLPQHQVANQAALQLLKLFPYLLTALFGFSFFWDFEGLSLTVGSLTLELEGLLRILSVSGMIGFLTNWLAIKMLFKPEKPRPLLGHGLIPAQKSRIAYRLASAISRDLINPEIIKEKIHKSQVITRYREQATGYMKEVIDDPEFRTELKSIVSGYIDELIADPEIRTALAATILEQIEEAIASRSLERLALRFYTFIKGQQAQEIVEESLRNLPDSVEKGLNRMDDLLDALPDKLDEHSDVIEEAVTTIIHRLVNQLDVHALVEDNINQFDEKRLENLIKGSTNEQLHYIQYLGAVLGTIGGLVIWEPLVSVTVLGIFTVLLLGADHLIVMLRRTSEGSG